MLDDDVGGTVEKRPLVLVGRLDLDDLDIEVVVPPRHLFDSEDHRRPVVVPVCERKLHLDRLILFTRVMVPARHPSG